MAEHLTPAAVRADVAGLLPELPDDDSTDLYEWGLDSIRLMTLLERWRDAGADISLVELAERPTLEHWLTLLTSRAIGGVDA